MIEESSDVLFLSNEELSVICALGGVQRMFGFKSNAETADRGELMKCVWNLVQKELLEPAESSFRLSSKMEAVRDVVCKATTGLAIQPADDSKSQRCCYIDEERKMAVVEPSQTKKGQNRVYLSDLNEFLDDLYDEGLLPGQIETNCDSVTEDYISDELRLRMGSLLDLEQDVQQQDGDERLSVIDCYDLQLMKRIKRIVLIQTVLGWEEIEVSDSECIMKSYSRAEIVRVLKD